MSNGDPQTVHVTVGQTLYFCNFMNPVSWVWEVAEDQDGARPREKAKKFWSLRPKVDRKIISFAA